jgi:polyisoprenoid-binding protein YceI
MKAKRFIWLVSLLLLPTVLFAAVQKWQIILAESSLTFIATQNNAPVTGSFRKFGGDIHFDPAKLNASSAHIVVETNSIQTSYSDLTDALIASSWLNVGQFPYAKLDIKKFTKLSDDHYQASGTLTIRDKANPINVTFTAVKLSDNKYKVMGNTSVSRTAFGIGQGEWSDTNEIKDKVEIRFNFTAQRTAS